MYQYDIDLILELLSKSIIEAGTLMPIC